MAADAPLKKLDRATLPALRPLTSARSLELLEWELVEGAFSYPGLVRIRTLPSPGALLHSILNAFFVPYRSQQFNHASEPVSRIEMVNAYREYLAERLAEPEKPAEVLSPLVYNNLSRGKMTLFANILKGYHLDVMQSELRDPDFFLDDKYLELIANDLEKDIYILDATTYDVRLFPNTTVDMYYKGRSVIVLLYIPGHFELVGICKPSGDVVTHFMHGSDFANALHQRYQELQDAAAEMEAAQDPYALRA